MALEQLGAVGTALVVEDRIGGLLVQGVQQRGEHVGLAGAGQTGRVRGRRRAAQPEQVGHDAVVVLAERSQQWFPEPAGSRDAVHEQQRRRVRRAVAQIRYPAAIRARELPPERIRRLRLALPQWFLRGCERQPAS